MKLKEGVEMKYLVTFVWGFILSQVTYYLGSALAQSPYNFRFVQGDIKSACLPNACVGRTGKP